MRRVRLSTFRNHTSSTIEFSDGTNLILGPNGAGKSSVLEAVCVGATGRSYRTRDLNCLVSDDSDVAVVETTVVRGSRETTVSIGFGPETNRRMSVNGAARTQSRDVFGIVRCVVFSPDDLYVVKGPAGIRRDTLDSILVACSPRTESVRSEWDRVLKQRNTLLRSIRGRSVTPPSLETWSDLVAEKGAALAWERRQMVTLLRPNFIDAVGEFGVGELQVGYAGEWFDDDCDSQNAMAERLRDELGSALPRERERGVTLAGPHRDDIELRIAGRDVRQRASQGEQRAVALGWRLAEIGIIGEVIGDEPVLLLDDVLSELDPKRRVGLIRQLPTAQTIITATSQEATGSTSPEVESAIGAFIGGIDHTIHIRDGSLLVDPQFTSVTR